MPNIILKYLIQSKPLTEFENWMIQEWQRNATEQELNYFTKIINAKI